MIKSLKHKFKAKATETDGIKFSSKKEAKRYQSLKTLQNIGEILFFLRQVPFHLPGGVKYVCDFLIFWANGSVTIEDVKGFKTESYKAKKKMVEAIYPITILEV
jgi:hypothetical protein